MTTEEKLLLVLTLLALAYPATVFIKEFTDKSSSSDLPYLLETFIATVMTAIGITVLWIIYALKMMIGVA